MTQTAGAMKFSLTCPRCDGTGRLRNKCPTCHGDGRIAKTETVDVRIPPGAQQGSRLRVAGKRKCRDAWRALRAICTSRFAWSRIPFFRREGDDIEITVPVRIDEAGLGTKIEVPTIDGRALLKIPQGTKNGQKFRLREKGVLNSRTGARGDQIVEVAIGGSRWCRTNAPRNCCASIATLHPEDPRAEIVGRRCEHGETKSKPRT